MTQDLPLAGVRVLELATVVAAPTAARIMAAYGAQVIKVEAPNGDLLRWAQHISYPQRTATTRCSICLTPARSWLPST